MLRPADEADLLDGLAALASNHKRMWAAVIGSEVTSLEHGDRIHRLLLDSGAPVDGDGTIATVADLARARLDGDADALAAVAGRLEGMGLRAAAMRAAADAIRVAGPASRPGHVSRCTALRLRRAWDGGPCWWLEGVDGLPTARQMEVAWRVVEGASVAEVAATLTVSHRTVENHLHRVYRLLDVSGREELGALLRRPHQRPADGSG